MEYNDFIKQAKLVTDEVETVGMRPTEAQKESVLSVILDAQNKYRFGDKFEKGVACFIKSLYSISYFIFKLNINSKIIHQ